MSYRGRVRNGVVEFDGGAVPPEGTAVEVVAIAPPQDELDDGSLAKELLNLAGSCKGLPSDLARNHDHYLYGAPKR